MTLDEAAEKYLDRDFSDDAWPDHHFKTGAEWAVKNDPRVLELVAALAFYRNELNWMQGIGEVTSPIIADTGAKAKTALSKWRGTP